MFKYAFGYILLCFAFLTVIIVRCAKRKLFLKKIRRTGDQLNETVEHLDEIFSREIWREPPFLYAAHQTRLQVRFVRENLADAESFLNTDDARANGSLEAARHWLQVIDGVIGSGVLACLVVNALKMPSPEPAKSHDDIDRSNLKSN